MRLSRWLRNRLPCPHSCISAKTRRVNNVISGTAAAATHGKAEAQKTATDQSSMRGSNVVRTCVNPLMFSDLPNRLIITRLCCLMKSIDNVMGTLLWTGGAGTDGAPSLAEALTGQ